MNESPLPPISPFRDLDRWHDLLSQRFVCETRLTRYFQPYRKCKACGARGSIRLLTAALFELADSDEELRTLIAQGQRMLLGNNSSIF